MQLLLCQLKCITDCSDFFFPLYTSPQIRSLQDWTRWFLSCWWDLWVFCAADSLFSRKCSAIISPLTHRHTQTERRGEREAVDRGRRLCVSDGGESSNSALSFSPLLSCGDLKEVSDWEKLSVVSSFLINSYIQFFQLSSSPPPLLQSSENLEVQWIGGVTNHFWDL